MRLLSVPVKYLLIFDRNFIKIAIITLLILSVSRKRVFS